MTDLTKPVMDAEELAIIVCDCDGLVGWEDLESKDRRTCLEIAEVVRDAVCPKGYRVVPEAEHDALVAKIDAVLAKERERQARGSPASVLVEPVEHLRYSLNAFRAALDQEPGA